MILASFWGLFFPTLFYAVAAFALVWMISEAVKNAGIVDIAWSCSFSAFAMFYAFAADGHPLRRLLILALVGLWSLRLGVHIWKRVERTHPVEDERYSMIREAWKPNERGKFLLFFEAQALLALVLSIPHLLVCLNRAPNIAFVEWLGAAVILIGLFGESIADKQLAAFKSDSTNKGKTCREGLWFYSRHPNYFFEFVVWVGFALMALGAPWGWLTLYAPALMLFFLWNITGIPLTEKRALESRGDDYRDYQETTSPFFPWFPKPSTRSTQNEIEP
jgi:steroid 5-alpha reductase family enzyme